MKNNIILGGIVVLLIGVTGGYFISQSGPYERGWMMWGKDSYSREGDDKKFSNNNEKSPAMGNMHGMHGANPVTEREFIQHMIPHHQEAVDTAKMVLSQGGSNEEMRDLAQNIILAQEAEITNMKSWYRTWYGEDYKDDGKYQPMMRDLTPLSGAELDKAFLEDMIMHHMGALMMAQQVSASIEHTEIRSLAENIAKTQSEEIITMRILLKQY
jgi:uncharacterized protein (DUF305 family)